MMDNKAIKHIMTIVLIVVTIVVPLASCNIVPNEISREPIDVKYTEAYTDIQTKHVYKYDWLNGKMVLVPQTETVYHDEVWSIKYCITYDNGEHETKWCSCTKSEYDRAKELLGGNDG